MLSENTYFEDQTCFYIFKNKNMFGLQNKWRPNMFLYFQKQKTVFESSYQI